jgi:DNA-directed RNA polymerase specialized sigma24 family protein
MRHPYHVACSYAYTLDRFLYKDLVHTAWVNHHKRTGGSLFDEAIPYILTAVKFVFRRHQQDFYFEWRRQRHLREWCSFENVEGQINNNLTPEQLLISKEFVESFESSLNNYKSNNNNAQEIGPELREFTRLKVLGYKNVEIAKEMGVSPQVITYYSKKIKSMIHNPLVTSTVKISKKITRKTYETNEQYKNYKYDPDKNCDFNEYYQIVVGPEGDYILVKEKEE